MNTEKCPHLRADLPELTARIAKLPIDSRGYPVPAFVQWLEIFEGKPRPCVTGVGYPEFRMASVDHWDSCVKYNRCWVCGESLGKHRASVIGPMCAVNLTSAEPPSHVDCAEWSVRGCPFLVKPQMKRREDDFIRGHGDDGPGIMIKRNPGVILVWHTTEPNRLFRDPNGGWLFRLPNPPASVRCFKEGRPATQPEVVMAIQQGLPSLLEQCADIEERNEVHRLVERLVMTL